MMLLTSLLHDEDDGAIRHHIKECEGKRICSGGLRILVDFFLFE